MAELVKGDRENEFELELTQHEIMSNDDFDTVLDLLAQWVLRGIESQPSKE